MIKNLSDYFLPKQEFYLDNISYRRLEKQTKANEYVLNCVDNISAKIDGDIVRLTVERVIKFEPKDIFDLSITFGVILKFNNDRKKEIDWEKIDLAEEFKENGNFVLSNLISRISLLVAEITSSFGQPPILLVPQLPIQESD